MARYPGSFGPDDDHGIGDVARRNAEADVREQFGTGGRTQNLPEDYGTGYPVRERHDRDHADERYGPHRAGRSRSEPPEWRGDAGWGRPWSGDLRGEPNAWRGDAGWGRAYGHRGRGPKNYTRSDARIQEDISERLWDADDVDASDVSVEVKDGEVTLRGTVEHRGIRHRIEDIADTCSGVKDIHNEIRVQRRNA